MLAHPHRKDLPSLQTPSHWCVFHYHAFAFFDAEQFHCLKIGVRIGLSIVNIFATYYSIENIREEIIHNPVNCISVGACDYSKGKCCLRSLRHSNIPSKGVIDALALNILPFCVWFSSYNEALILLTRPFQKAILYPDVVLHLLLHRLLPWIPRHLLLLSPLSSIGMGRMESTSTPSISK